MGNIKQINIKNRTYYSFNDMINIENFDSNLLEIEKKPCKNILQILCIFLSIKQMNTLKKAMEIKV